LLLCLALLRILDPNVLTWDAAQEIAPVVLRIMAIGMAVGITGIIIHMVASLAAMIAVESHKLGTLH